MNSTSSGWSRPTGVDSFFPVAFHFEEGNGKICQFASKTCRTAAFTPVRKTVVRNLVRLTAAIPFQRRAAPVAWVDFEYP